ncbi:MAG: ATPase domain-containing protein [Dehalococcoidia bacterium]|nr:ATPase domain-containing protein [Dehalococcoidia bacterium]
MKESRAVRIKKLSTGVPGLDTVLGDGLPEYSFNLIAGAPGSGKTTMAHQIMFANASPDRPALYLTVLGEPPIKMLRYQQQMRFFDPDKLDSAIKFMDLSQEVMEQDLDKVFDSIVTEVRSMGPRIVVVDSFRGVARAGKDATTDVMALPAFVQRLALYLTSWQATTFLVGDYADAEIRDNPVFTVADGIIWLFQSVERNSMVRKLQVMKMRGQPTMPGLHTFRITQGGLRVFPRLIARAEEDRKPSARRRIPSGVAGLDGMLGGGIQAGDSVLVSGPSGSGKTVFATQFIAEGAGQGENGVIAVFEEHPAEYVARAKGLGFDLEGLSAQGKVRVLYLRPQDLSTDETLYEITEAVRQLGAKRVVIDSLSGFELALAPTFRDDFRESLHRMVGALTGIGVTVLMTVEIIESYNELRFSPHMVSFLADDIILQRYAEIGGRLQKVIAVIKMRSSDHSKDLRAYEITDHGLVIGETLKDYRGIIMGVPEFNESRRR